jgi:hypothetical protein
MDCTKGPWACVAMLLLLTACPGGGETDGDGSSTTGPDDLTTGPMATTIPLPPIDSSGSSDDAGTTLGSTDEGTTTEPTTTGSTSLDGSSSDGGTSSSGEPGESSSDGGPTSYPVDWCILQYPPSVMTTVGVPFTVYVRLFAPGLSDQTGVTDPAPELVVEVGYSVDGSDPSTGMGAPWTWEAATPNAGYGPGAPGYGAVNDEYQHDLAIPMAGVFDYAARISGDSGTTWVYCDLDGLAVNGYTPDQAGAATIDE